MPSIVNTDIGEIRFSDEYSPEQITEILRTQLPSWRERVSKGAIGDLASRVPRDLALGGAGAMMGLARGWQQIKDYGQVSGLRQMGALAALEAPVGEENAAIQAANDAADAKAKELESTREQRLAQNPLYRYGEESRRNAREFYQTNPLRDESIPAMLSQAGSSVVTLAPAALAGPLAPAAAAVIYGAQAGQQGAEEAIAMGHPDKADEAFLLFAGLGALSEAALGYPIAFLRKVVRARQAGVDPVAFGRSVKERLATIGGRTVREGLEGVGREGLQEGTEQGLQNVVASDIVGYDPERPLLQGVPQATAIGSVVGGGVGGVGGAAMAIDEARARRTAEAQIPAILRSIEQAQPVVPQFPATAEQRAAESAGQPIPLNLPEPPPTREEALDSALSILGADFIHLSTQRGMPWPIIREEAINLVNRGSGIEEAINAVRNKYRIPTAEQVRAAKRQQRVDPYFAPDVAQEPVPAPRRRSPAAPTVEEFKRNLESLNQLRPEAATVPATMSIPAPSTEAAKMDILPPVPPGYVRMYHGGSDPRGELNGPRDITQYLDYAQGYADKNKGTSKVWYVDVPENAPYMRKGFEEFEGGPKSPWINTVAPDDVMRGAKEVPGTTGRGSSIQVKALPGPPEATVKDSLIVQPEAQQKGVAPVESTVTVPSSEASAGLKALPVGEETGPTTRSGPPPARAEEGARETGTLTDAIQTQFTDLTFGQAIALEAALLKNPKRAEDVQKEFLREMVARDPNAPLGEMASLKSAKAALQWFKNLPKPTETPNAIRQRISETPTLGQTPQARQEVAPQVRDAERPAVPQAETPQAQGTVKPPKQIVVVTNSHRQVSRLPESATGGLPISLGSKARYWYLDDTPANRSIVERYGLKINATRTRQRNQAKYSVTLSEPTGAPAVTPADIEAAFPAAQGFDVRPVSMTMVEPDGSQRVSNSFLIKLPNSQAILVDPTLETIHFDPTKAAADWGLDPQTVAQRGVARGVYRSGGAQVSGLSRVGLIELLNTSDPSTLSHEKFHALFDMALTEEERAAILDRYKTEEKAAEAFRRSEGFTRTFWEKIRRFIEWLANLVRGDAFRKLRQPLTTEAVTATDSEPKYSLEEVFRSKKSLEDFIAKPTISPEEAASLRQQAGTQAGLVPDAIAAEVSSLNPADPVEKRMIPYLDFVLKLHGMAPALELQRVLSDPNIPEDTKQAAISGVLLQIEHVRAQGIALEEKLQKANKKLATAIEQGGKITKERLVQARAKQIADNLISRYRQYLTAQAANLPANQNVAAVRSERIRGLDALLTRELAFLNNPIPGKPSGTVKAIEAIAARISELPVNEGPQAVADAIRQKGILHGVVDDDTIDLLTKEKPGGFSPLLVNPEANEMLKGLADLQKKSETYAKQIEVIEQAFRIKGEPTPVELKKFADTYRKFRNKQLDAAKAIREYDNEFQEADDDVQVYGRSHDIVTRLQNDPQFVQQFETAVNRPGGEIFRDILNSKNPELEKVYTSPLVQETEDGKKIQKTYRVFLSPDKVSDEDTLRDMQMLVAEIDEFLQGDVNPVDRKTWETRRDYISKYLLQPKFSQKVPMLKFGSVNLNLFSVVQLIAGGRARGPRSELEKMAFRAANEANTTFRVADQALVGYKLISNNTEFGDEAIKVATLEAVASHGWDVDRISHWSDTVLNPILASGQTAGQMRLKEGDFIPGTGVKITKQDMEAARKQKRFSQGIVQTTQGTAKNLPGILVENPVLIKTTILGRKGLRGAISPGPLTMARTFSEWSKLFSKAWTKKSPEGRRSMVMDGEHFEKAVLGYVSTTNPEFNNASPYKSVYETFAARAKEDEQYQVQSLDQLLDRLAAIAVEQKLFLSVAEAAPKIEEALLSEIGEHVTAIQKHFADEGITDETPQTVIQYASAKSAFTTARKNMLAPDPYYQYTLTHGSDRLGFVAAGYQQFQLRQIDALNALKAALDRKEAEFKEEIGRLKHKGMSERKAEATVQKKSETQLDRTRFSMINLHDHKRVIEKVVKDLTETVIDVRDPNDSIALTALQRVTKNLSSSLLSSPTALANNYFGGIAANSVILRNLGRAHVVWTPLKSTAHTTGALVKKVLLTFAPQTAIGKVAHSKANLPIIKDMALMVDNLLRGWTQQYLEMQARGLVAPTDMRNRLRAQAALKTSAGAIERGRPPLVAAIPNWLESQPGMRWFLGHLRDKVPRLGDEVVNMGAAGIQTSEVFDFLKLRAEKAFEGREAAGEDINAPNYFANEQNLLSPKELGMVESTGYRDADSMRQMFEIVGNLDGFLLNYYNRLKKVPADQKHTVPLFENPADEGAVLYDMNAHGNIPTPGFTPPSMTGVGQRGLLKSMLFMFQNYVLRQAAQAERMADKDLRDPKGWREAYALWGIFATLIVWALAGMLATETGVPLTKTITGRSPSRVTAANVIADPDAAMLARYVGMALGNNLPYYGQVISQVLGNPGYGSKWDAANLIPIAGLIRDVNTAATRIGQTGDPIFPAIDFLSRWLPPVSPALRLLPGVEGDIERRNAERALRVVGPSAGMELAGGGGGNAVQTPASAAVRRLISAAYRGDQEGIRSAFDEAVREKTEAGSPDPERAVMQSLASAVPARRVFGKSITPSEEAQLTGLMSGGQRSNYAEAQNAFDLINQTLGTRLNLTTTPRARTRGQATRRALFSDSASPIFATRRSRSRRRRLGGRGRSAFRRLRIRGSSRRRRRSPARFSFAA